MVSASLLFLALLVWMSALVQNLNHARLLGPAFVMSDRSISPASDGVSGRMSRALANLVETGLMYIPVALLAIMHHLDTDAVRWAAGGFMFARAGYLMSYWFAANTLRSALWTLGMLCTAVIFAEVCIALT